MVAHVAQVEGLFCVRKGCGKGGQLLPEDEELFDLEEVPVVGVRREGVGGWGERESVGNWGEWWWVKRSKGGWWVMGERGNKKKQR